MLTQNLTPNGYLPRIADAKVERYLSIFGAIEVSGTKWCGKTWTSLAHGRSVIYIDDEYEAISADPRLATRGERPHVIDEWQLVPGVWDAVRREADKVRGLRGGWILTGSSSPLSFDTHAAPRHSGAGRIGRVRMFPMSLAESGDSSGEISLAALFEGAFEPTLLNEVAKDAQALVELACRGGWPEAIGFDVPAAQELAREYLRVLCYDTAPRRDMDGQSTSRLVTSVSRTLGQAATQATLYADMDEKVTGPLNSAQKARVTSYLRLLRSCYILEEIYGWVPAARSPKRLSTKPKRYLADPSLAVAALGMGPGSLIRDWQTFGTVFENLCMRDLLVYASALPGAGFEPVRYYRDDTGLEVDAIIELADGRWAAVEIKTSEDKVQEGVDNLVRLRRKLCENSRARVREPEFLAVLVGLSRIARKTPEGIYVIPVRALGA